MGILGVYLRKIYTLFKGEVLILPSRIVVFLFFVVVLSLPVFAQDPYLLRILILTSIFAILAASWDLLSGFTGQVNFGHALFFGVGAYTSGLLNLHAQIPPWGSIPLGAVAAVVAGLIVGIPCLRLRGTYLALTTLAFPIILMGIVFAIPDITGGELGVSGLSRLSGSRLHDYYITVVLMLGLCTIMSLQTPGVQPEWVVCRDIRGALRTFHENCRPLYPGSLNVFYGGNLGGIRGDRYYIRACRGSIYPFSLAGVLPFLARVSDVNVRGCHLADPSLHAGRASGVGTRQDRKRVPQVQDKKRGYAQGVPCLYSPTGLALSFFVAEEN
jgi:hypothetical protein